MGGIIRIVIEYSGDNEDGSAALAIVKDERTDFKLLRMLRDDEARKAYKTIRELIEGGKDDTR